MTDVARVRQLGGGAPLPPLPLAAETVVFAGRLELRKGVEVLAEAMPLVWERRPGVHLVVIGAETWGNGALAEGLRRRLSVRPGQAHFVGDQPPERLFPSLAAADVVTFPSLWEAFGIVALEAMALGCAIVATSGSGFSDFLADGENGVLVPPRDPEALASAIVGLLSDRDLRRRYGAAAAKSAERFDAARVSRQHADFLSELVARREV
jgi:glycosyltransferase involved in cell wall biosynthesis